MAAPLGRQPTLDVWQAAFVDYDDELLLYILSAGWCETAAKRTDEMEQSLTDKLAVLFPQAVNGLSAAEAHEVVMGMPPFCQIRARFDDALDVERQTTTYEALHLFRDGLALLAETIIDRYGKAGELMIYDAMLEESAEIRQHSTSVEEFMSRRLARFSGPPEESDMHSAGLEVRLVRGSESEVVTSVQECEWARYYLERHPSVGYLLACSVDNAIYTMFNEYIRLQRTCTLMEGGPECDFRVYAL